MEPDEPAAIQREKSHESIASYVVLAALLYALIQAYSLLSPILLNLQQPGRCQTLYIHLRQLRKSPVFLVKQSLPPILYHLCD